MKHWIGVVALGVIAAGCQSSPKPDVQTTSPTVLDVGPAAAHQPSVYVVSTNSTPVVPAAHAAGYQPPSAEPVYVPPPAVDVMPAPSEDTYIVKSGDTLYHIAKVKYGNGKRWRDIAAANPGVTPATIKAGQKLNLP